MVYRSISMLVVSIYIDINDENERNLNLKFNAPRNDYRLSCFQNLLTCYLGIYYSGHNILHPR